MGFAVTNIVAAGFQKISFELQCLQRGKWYAVRPVLLVLLAGYVAGVGLLSLCRRVSLSLPAGVAPCVKNAY